MVQSCEDSVKRRACIRRTTLSSHGFCQLADQLVAGFHPDILASRKNGGDKRSVSLTKSLGEVVEQVDGPRILVRFEHSTDASSRVLLSGGSDCAGDRRGVVSVIIDDRHASEGADFLKPAFKTGEREKCSFNFCHRNAQFGGDGNGGQCVHDMMSAEQWQQDVTVMVSAVAHAKHNARFNRADVLCMPSDWA